MLMHENSMYGEYRKDLAKYAKSEAARLQRDHEELQRWHDSQKRRASDGIRINEEGPETFLEKCRRALATIRDEALRTTSVGNDWLFLALLGTLMALLSFGIDYCIALFQKGQVFFFHALDGQPFPQYLLWILYPTGLILFSAVFTYYVEPNGVGSGIPELKTILRGVVLKEYLSFRTLVSKVVGLACSLGSSLPLGKVGPFVHIASMLATVLNRWMSKLTGNFVNEYHNYDMLAAACAVGVACTFSAPIGGLLFSIEVTTSYFAVRNYWRGFFAATCAALVFRLLAVWGEKAETITALYKSTFRIEFPYDVVEVIFFALIGVICGFGGALFIYMHRKIVHFNRRKTILKKFLQKSRYIYPVCITIIISTFTFPLGFGQFMAGELTPGQVLTSLFSNETWVGATEEEIAEATYAKYWLVDHNVIFLSLGMYVLMTFWMTTVSITMPVAHGIFMPVFIVGAAFGRFVGEAMAAWFPEGFWQGGEHATIIPGGYAVVGAAALSGAVTHTVSTSVIVAEMTGQITHILPVMVAVLIANAISQLLQPSVFNSIIQLKKLPYLPDIAVGEGRTHNILAEDIMNTKLDYIAYEFTYMDLKYVLSQTYHRNYPLLDNDEKRTLYGVVARSELEYLVEQHMGRDARIAEAKRRLEAGTLSVYTPARQREVRADSKDLTVHFDDQSEHAESPTGDSPAGSVATSAASPKPALKRTSFPKDESIHSLGSSGRSDHGLIDLNPEEQLQWESSKLKYRVNFDPCIIDAAPLYVVEKTSLHKIHTLFSLLGVSKAYVTNMGCLVGIVGLEEVRQAIEGSGIYDSDSDADDDMFYDTYEKYEDEYACHGDRFAHEMTEMVTQERS
ncbi:chloride channel protein 2-like isoform X2 [Ptychodera flava]|uniref:chloride channel protein 2-like isoform X2 n=1 Tax=Ptychodera flava TaxID=63121 RepID=UPI00396A5B2E